MSELEGRIAVITGAASGIGKALAAFLAKEGSRVVLVDVQAIRRDKPLYVHYPPGKILDLRHRMSRRSFLACSATLYGNLGRRMPGK